MFGTAQLPENPEELMRERLVTIRPEVLNDAEHALGNLFQRIYHATRLSREALGPQAERLTAALGDLERLLELVFDYVSPVEVRMRPTPAARVAESLAAQIRAHTEGEVAVGSCPPVAVSADARLLRRSFELLSRAWSCHWEAASRIALDVLHDEAFERAEFVVRAPIRHGAGAPVDGKLALAVAARLVELHGGELRHGASDALVTCSVILPTAKASHVAV